jgi:hypothetical protein
VGLHGRVVGGGSTGANRDARATKSGKEDGCEGPPARPDATAFLTRTTRPLTTPPGEVGVDRRDAVPSEPHSAS